MNDPDRTAVFPAAPRQLPPGLLVRATRPQDAAAIAEMHNLPGFRWGTLRLPFAAPEEVKTWIENRAPGSVNLVAILDGEIVGGAGLDRYKGRRSHAGGIGMGVHDAWTGRGIGAALLTALVDMADRWLGLRRLELTVFADNMPAIALYRRFGFQVEGTHRAFALRDGVYVDALAMARLCGPSG
jgi:putative acetyltransferase